MAIIPTITTRTTRGEALAMIGAKSTRGFLAVSALTLGGCATAAPEVRFEEVRAGLEERGEHRVHWYQGTEEDEAARGAVASLLAEPLTADAAVQIALLNNRRLQATYQELGIAQADLVQAGLLHNPVFSGEILFPTGEGTPQITLGVAQSFLDVFYRPLRRRRATSRLEEATLEVTGAVLDLAYQTRIAFYQAQAAAQRLEMLEHVVLATELGYDFARQLHQAGNITELELAQQRDLYESARLDLRRAEAALAGEREVLNRALGLFGEDTRWQITGRLPELPEAPLDLEGLESRVVAASLDLAVAAQRIVTAGRTLGIDESVALLPELELGVEAKREHGEWLVGPALALPIPLFDRGQARIARTRAELRQQQERYAALAVEIRSIARQAQGQLTAAEEIAGHYRRTILPLRQRIVGEAQLQYNAMQIGLPDLLRAREQQIEAGGRYIQALFDYWIAWARIDQLLAGRAPHDGGLPAPAVATDPNH
jgi:outer membrane protein, heavy metal efflux system